MSELSVTAAAMEPAVSEQIEMQAVSASEMRDAAPAPKPAADESKPDALDDNEPLVRSSTPKANRELKSILELAKEARLDTNISSNRRKTIDNTESELFDTSYDDDEEDANASKLGKKRKGCFGENAIEGAQRNDGVKSMQGLSAHFIMAKKPNKDTYCWRCHHECVQIACETCPRSYHIKCLKQNIMGVENWVCPECCTVLKAENTKTRSKAMKEMTLEHLCSLLKFAVKRMIQCNGSEPFMHPVDEKQFPEYRNYIIHPMTLNMLQNNIRENSYGSTTAFEADAKWIVHNSVIFNSYQSKLTTAAKTIVKICKQEMAEIENCASCYRNANTKKHTWFVEVCPKPHLLVWAKLKGFPYWPAKVMSINANGMADVRFFGAHDKAWVSCKDCYLYSAKDPNSGKQKRNDIIECQKELELYVENLRKIYGVVVLAPIKTFLDADKQMAQLEMFLPSYKVGGDGGKKGVEKGKEEEKKVEKKEEEKKEEERVKTPIREAKKANGDTSNGSPVQAKTPTGRFEYNLLPVKVTDNNPFKAVIVRRDGEMITKIVKMPLKKSPTPTPTSTPTPTPTPTPISTPQPSEKSQSEDDKLSPNSKLKMTEQLIKKLETDEDPPKISDTSTPIKQPEITDTPSGMDRSLIRIRPVGKTDTEVDQKSAESTEEEESQEISVEIDPANICSIIHSSLSPPKKQPDEPPVAKTPPIVKKRKLDEIEPKTDEKKELSPLPPRKLVKLVPIEDILQKKVETGGKKPEFRVIIKTPCEKKQSDSILEPEIQIKAEIESEEEEDEMEAKRQYLSALNISEKQKIPTKPKTNEIRTRSKTEEKKNKPIELSDVTIRTIPKLGTKHKARKSFPQPNYGKKAALIARQIMPKPNEDGTIRLVNTSTLQPISGGPSVMILPKLHYNKQPPPLTRDLSSPPVLKMLPRPPVAGAPTAVVEGRRPAEGSQNYIPQSQERMGGAGEGGKEVESLEGLREMLPETVSKTMTEILVQQPPKLKAKPTGLLAVGLEAGTPSSAGPVAAKINSMANKLGDYFRTLLVETISDLGKSNNPEATICSLKLEIEEIQHRQTIELSEIRRNVSVALKDIQKCVIEERDRISTEVKSNCELDSQKKVEEAKSKQWCASCFKEAQFYCCWNTSYCDYPCQQKHWAKHMNKCTQNATQTTPSSPQQLVLNTSKFGFAKPQKVYLKRAQPFKGATAATTTTAAPTGHVTLVESTPGSGSYELLSPGSISVNGKILASGTVLEKLKSGGLVSVAAPAAVSTTTSAATKVRTIGKAKSNASSSSDSSEAADKDKN